MEVVAKDPYDGFNPAAQEKIGARDDGNWGPCDIAKKALEIFKGHACLLNLIQITIVFPCTVLWLLNQHYIKILIHTFMPVPPGPPCEDPCPAPSPSDRSIPHEWRCVLAFIVLLLLGFVFWVNAVGSIFYSVGSIYAGKTISFRDVLKQLPCLWNGLFVTGLWGYVFFIIVAVTVFLLGSVLMTFSSVSFLPLPVAFFFTLTFAAVSFFYLGTTTQMANAATVFEQICGLPAFCRALKLLKCKWCVASGLALIAVLPQLILVAIINAATWAWSENCARWPLFLILAYFLALVLELNVISSALLYFSAKQTKQETISVDHFFLCSQVVTDYQKISSFEQHV